MILYFDSFITDVPFNKAFIDPNKWVRESVPAYKMPSKIDIAKYTLASYATYPWSHVLIRYTLADTSRITEFEAYARELFPNAVIMQPNSSNQTEYRKSLTIMNEWDDDWIWYAPNNDHPIMTHDLSIIDTALAKAKIFAQNHEFVSIIYSHFSEFINIAKPGNPFWKLFGQDTAVIDEDESTLSYMQKNGENAAIQIVNKKLLSYWFDSAELGDAVIYRSEDVRKFYKTPNQIIVMPKREIAAHFDGYSHTIQGFAEIAADQVPPLSIPEGFFNNKIKIKYGYTTYDPSYTNVNPIVNKYSFEKGKDGTDLKLEQDKIPFFWKGRISEFQINEHIKAASFSNAAVKNTKIITNPYSLKNKKLNLQTVKYLIRHLRHKFRLI